MGSRLTVYIFYSRTSRRGQTCDTRTQEPKTPNLIRGLFRRKPLDLSVVVCYRIEHGNLTVSVFMTIKLVIRLGHNTYWPYWLPSHRQCCAN